MILERLNSVTNEKLSIKIGDFNLLSSTSTKVEEDSAKKDVKTSPTEEVETAKTLPSKKPVKFINLQQDKVIPDLLFQENILEPQKVFTKLKSPNNRPQSPVSNIRVNEKKKLSELSLEAKRKIFLDNLLGIRKPQVLLQDIKLSVPKLDQIAKIMKIDIPKIEQHRRIVEPSDLFPNQISTKQVDLSKGLLKIEATVPDPVLVSFDSKRKQESSSTKLGESLASRIRNQKSDRLKESKLCARPRRRSKPKRLRKRRKWNRRRNKRRPSPKPARQPPPRPPKSRPPEESANRH